MKGGRRTAKGKIINIDDVIASAPHTTSVGNMKVNAQGDKLGPSGEIQETREKRTRSYYKDHPQSSNRKVSLKGEMQEAFSQGHSDFNDMSPKTSKTHEENIRTSDSVNQDKKTKPVAEAEIPEPEEFNLSEMPEISENITTPPLDENGDYTIEPDGYEEIELENGDIVVKPYWLSDTQEDDQDSQS